MPCNSPSLSERRLEGLEKSMKTLKKELRPDWATAERLYPLILKRLEQYETFWDA